MKKTLLTLAIAAISTTALMAQSDPVVMEVGGQKIRQSEFMKDFNATGNKDDIEEYANLYAVFRAKELDAHQLGMDTASRMLRELAHYRKDLAAPYLIDSAVLRHILDEAYERNHYSLRAAHILVAADLRATPEDTLAAYNHIRELRQRIDNGEDFNTVAFDEIRSKNPKAQPRPVEGDLGYFSVFDMVYPFENAAYALQMGEVSQPVRTRFGYHLIKLLDRVELYGKITMAHIWLHSTDSTKDGSINFIYNQLMEGTPFEIAARQSDDRTTSDRGGVLANATLSQLPPEYIHQLVNMKEGDISKPFFTQYGWHIIKLIKRDTLPQPEDLESFYKQRLTRDQRGEQSRKAFAATARKKYGIIDLTVTPQDTPQGRKAKKNAPVKMKANLDELIRVVPDSVMSGIWRFNKAEFTDTTPLIITPRKQYTSLDVARFIHERQHSEQRQRIANYVQQRYNEFLDSISIDYADSMLEHDYPEFAQIVNDYRRGLIIFSYNDKMIWRKAVYDTAGYEAFYARESVKKQLSNPDDSIFFYHPRARVTVLDIADSNAIPSSKAVKIITKAQRKNMGSSEMRQLLLKKMNRKDYPNDNLVEIDVEMVEKTRQNLLNDNQWQRGIYVKPANKGYRMLVVDETFPRSLKSSQDARGYYLSAWQNEIEQQLSKELLEKYNVKIYHDVIRSIKY